MSELIGAVEHDLGLISYSGLSASQLARALGSLHIRAAEILATQGNKNAARSQLENVFIAACQVDDSADDVTDRIRETAIKYDID